MNNKKQHLKSLSAGIIIRCPDGYLVCHPTGKSWKQGNWDIPKGHVEGNDKTYLKACLRELKEETGLEFTEQYTAYIKTIGLTAYNPKKDLYLFFLQLPYNIDVKDLKCSSMFETNDGRTLPEMDGYKLTDDISWLYPNLQKVFNRIFN